MDVSFIIPTLNEEKGINDLLISIKEQYLPEITAKIEIIVVDNGSDDRTVEIAKKHADGVYVLPDLSIAALRNYGAARSTGEIIIFADADNVLSANTLKVVFEAFKIDEIGILGANGLIPYQKASWVQKAWYIHTKKMNRNENLFEVKSTGSGFMVLKRRLFERVKGFNELLGVREDTDLCDRVRTEGYKVYKSKHLIIYNRGHPKDLIHFIKREFWHGDSFKQIIIHKRGDINSVYLFFNSLMLVFLFLSLLLPFANSGYLLLPLFYTLVPSSYRAFKKRKRFDGMFLQLFCLYLIYIYTRTIALYKEL